VPAEAATVLGSIAAVASAPFVLAGGYLLLLAIASLGRVSVREPAKPRLRVAVLVPAHDEEQFIGRCLQSLREQSYPPELMRIVVIADNCGDCTADVAARAGAEVMVREDPLQRGKGHALQWAMARLLEGHEPPDAFVVVDADSVADGNLLRELAAVCEGGAEAVQAEYLVLPSDDSARAQLVAAGFLLFHRVRFAGRARLGLPVALVGNGMLFTRSLIERHPWNAFTGVEDIEYTMRLRLAGVRVRYAAAARLQAAMPSSYRGMAGQRLRWEGGRFHSIRTWVPALAKRMVTGDAGVIDTLVDLLVPPLGVLAMAELAGALVTAIAAAFAGVPAWALAGWLAALVATALFVGVGLRSAGAPASVYVALLEVPRFLAWKLLWYARLLRGFDPRRWDRAERVAP
jgi:hypothetical protein